MYLYYNQELKNSPEYMVLRNSSKKWIIEKIIFSTSVLIIFKALQIVIVNLLFMNKIEFQINYYINTILYSILIAETLLLLNNFKNMLIKIILIGILVFLFYHFELWISIVLNLIYVILNIKLFNFKKYYKKQNYFY